MAPSVPGDAPTRYVESAAYQPPHRLSLGEAVVRGGGWHGGGSWREDGMVMRGGGRPMAPMAPRANVNPLAGALAPFYAPRGNSEANSEAVYQLFMPLLANMRPHARAPPPVDPNVLPAVTTMISKAL